MIAPRFSVMAIVVATGLIAVDLAWLRLSAIYGRSALRLDYLSGYANAFLFDLGIMGMVNLLAIGGYLLASAKGRRRQFFIGFEIAGLIAMAVYLWVCLRYVHLILPEPRMLRSWGLHSIGEVYVGLMPETLRSATRGQPSLIGLIAIVLPIRAAQLVVLTLPQALIAVVGGRLAIRLAKQRSLREIRLASRTPPDAPSTSP